jgi:hypothetical protein
VIGGCSTEYSHLSHGVKRGDLSQRQGFSRKINKNLLDNIIVVTDELIALKHYFS